MTRTELKKDILFISQELLVNGNLIRRVDDRRVLESLIQHRLLLLYSKRELLKALKGGK